MIEKRSLKEVFELSKAAAAAWSDDYAPSMGAALSYYTVFSMAPLLLIVIAIAGLVFGADAARGEIFEQLRGLMGADAAKAIESLLVSVSKPSEGITATSVGVVVLVVGATSVFGELQNALDRIWRAPARDTTSSIWLIVRTRLLSLGMILGIAFLLMVSLVLGAVIAALGRWWGAWFGDWEVVAQVVNLVVGYVLTTCVFAMIYKLMPRVHVRWHDVGLGALVTAALFTVGKFLIGLYIGKSSVASGFGAAGSLVIVLVWVYYSAQIFLMGAEFTWVYARTFGSMRGQITATKPLAGEGVTGVADASAASGTSPASAASVGAAAAATASAVPSKAVRDAGVAGGNIAPKGGPSLATTAAASAVQIGLSAALVVAVRFFATRLARRF